MNVTLEWFLYLVAFVLLVLAALGLGLPRFAFGWAGLALAVFTFGVLPGF